MLYLVLTIIIDSAVVSLIEKFESLLVNQQHRVADKIYLDPAQRYKSSHQFFEYWSSMTRSKIDCRQVILFLLFKF